MWVVEVQNPVDQTWRPALHTPAAKAGLKIATLNPEWGGYSLVAMFKTLDPHREYRLTEYGPVDNSGSGI